MLHLIKSLSNIAAPMLRIDRQLRIKKGTRIWWLDPKIDEMNTLMTTEIFIKGQEQVFDWKKWNKQLEWQELSCWEITENEWQESEVCSFYVCASFSLKMCSFCSLGYNDCFTATAGQQP